MHSCDSAFTSSGTLVYYCRYRGEPRVADTVEHSITRQPTPFLHRSVPQFFSSPVDREYLILRKNALFFEVFFTTCSRIKYSRAAVHVVLVSFLSLSSSSSNQPTETPIGTPISGSLRESILLVTHTIVSLTTIAIL